jgi:hypothetical protein
MHSRESIGKIIVAVIFTASMLGYYRIAFAADQGLDFRQIHQAVRFFKQTGQNPIPEYTPLSIGLYLPLAGFPVGIAYVLWCAVTAALLAASAFFLHSQFGVCRDPYWTYLLFFAFLPTHILFLQGQSDGLLLLGFVITFVLMSMGRDFLAGIAITLGLIKFYLVIPFVLILILRKKLLFFAGFTVGTGISLFISAMIAGTSTVIRYPSLVWQVIQGRISPSTSGYSPELMANLRGLYFFLSGRELPLTVLAVLSLLIVVLAALWWSTLEQGFSGAVIATLLVSYHLNPHDLLLLLIPLAIAFRQLDYLSLEGFIFLGIALPVLPKAALTYHCFPLMTLLIIAFGCSFWTKPSSSADLISTSGDGDL